DSCGEEIIPTGPDESTVPSCEGIVTYTWTYEDCAGGMQAYVHTVTIDLPAPPVLPGQDSIVLCVEEAQIPPIPPVVVNACGDTLTVSAPVAGMDPVCAGEKIYTYTYTDCAEATTTWVFTYVVQPPTSSLPPDSNEVVACIADALVIPEPPLVNNSCQDTLQVTGPVITGDPDCSGEIAYAWTYTDCTGNSADWTFTYTILPPTMELSANVTDTVDCLEDAQVIPVPPVELNSCGDTLQISGSELIAESTCDGEMVYAW